MFIWLQKRVKAPWECPEVQRLFCPQQRYSDPARSVIETSHTLYFISCTNVKNYNIKVEKALFIMSETGAALYKLYQRPFIIEMVYSYTLPL